MSNKIRARTQNSGWSDPSKKKKIRKPVKSYTYLVTHKSSGMRYYGVRTANKLTPKIDLGFKYYTSSDEIKKILEEEGRDAFVWEIRKEFDCPITARKYEAKVLKRLNVSNSEHWFNKSGGSVSSADKKPKPIKKNKPKENKHFLNKNDLIKAIQNGSIFEDKKYNKCFAKKFPVTKDTKYFFTQIMNNSILEDGFVKFTIGEKECKLLKDRGINIKKQLLTLTHIHLMYEPCSMTHLITEYWNTEPSEPLQVGGSVCSLVKEDFGSTLEAFL
jgi:hypothetical protein